MRLVLLSLVFFSVGLALALRLFSPPEPICRSATLWSMFRAGVVARRASSKELAARLGESAHCALPEELTAIPAVRAVGAAVVATAAPAARADDAWAAAASSCLEAGGYDCSRARLESMVRAWTDK